MMLLSLSLIACVWATAGLIRPSLMPTHVTVINLVLIGAFLAIECPDDALLAVARYSILTICFGVGSAAFLICDKSRFGLSLSAAASLYHAYMALVRYTERRRAGSI